MFAVIVADQEDTPVLMEVAPLSLCTAVVQIERSRRMNGDHIPRDLGLMASRVSIQCGIQTDFQCVIYQECRLRSADVSDATNRKRGAVEAKDSVAVMKF